MPVVATQCMMRWAQAIALQESSNGCVRMSKHSSWSRTYILSIAKGGLGDWGRGTVINTSTHPMIMFLVIPFHCGGVFFCSFFKCASCTFIKVLTYLYA